MRIWSAVRSPHEARRWSTKMRRPDLHLGSDRTAYARSVHPFDGRCATDRDQYVLGIAAPRDVPLHACFNIFCYSSGSSETTTERQACRPPRPTRPRSDPRPAIRNRPRNQALSGHHGAGVRALAFALGVLFSFAGSASARTTDAFHSRALDSSLHYLVQLPSGYATSGLRYPVVYFLHGLPAGPTAYEGVSWAGSALAGEGKPAILVVPQGTRKQGGDPEYHDWGPGNNWETALAVELPRWIDAHYRTIASRRGRAIVGVSAGGYGAASLGLSHPAVFSVVESWSGYFEPTDPTGTQILDLGSATANAAASVHDQARALARQFRNYPTFFGFYVGRSDPTFLDENIELNRELEAADVPHVYAVYPGVHSTALWRAEAPYWLRMALNHLAPATG